jgi:hypothetical protein
MAAPAVSMCVLRWMDYHVKDGPLTGNGAFLTILPIFLQLLVTAMERQPLQRPDCFATLRAVLALRSLSSGEDEVGKHLATDSGAYTIINVHENALECLVHLVGLGYCIAPLEYLAKHAAGLDAVLLKHTLKMLLASITGPFSAPFARLFFAFLSDHLPLVQRWTKDEAMSLVAFRDSLLLPHADDESEDVDKTALFSAFDSCIGRATR